MVSEADAGLSQSTPRIVRGKIICLTIKHKWYVLAMVKS